MSYVYILKLKEGSYYTGSCHDLLKRMKEHGRGYVKSTRHKLPFELVYAREFETYGLARKKELRIKAWKKRRSIENLCKHDINNLISQAPSSNGLGH